MQRYLIAFCLSVLFCSATSARAEDDMATQLIAEINAFRVAQGVQPLRTDPRLTAAAARHSRNMAEQDCFDHICPGGSSPGQRLAEAGYRYRKFAENIAAGQPTAKNVVAGWKQSPPHRRNMLLPDARDVGAGYFMIDPDDGKVAYRHYWTMLYGVTF